MNEQCSLVARQLQETAKPANTLTRLSPPWPFSHTLHAGHIHSALIKRIKLTIPILRNIAQAAGRICACSNNIVVDAHISYSHRIQFINHDFDFAFAVGFDLFLFSLCLSRLSSCCLMAELVGSSWWRRSNWAVAPS